MSLLLEGVSLSYGSTPVIRKLSLAVDAGEMVALEIGFFQYAGDVAVELRPVLSGELFRGDYEHRDRGGGRAFL